MRERREGQDVVAGVEMRGGAGNFGLQRGDDLGMLDADRGDAGLLRRWSEPDQPDAIVVGTGSNRIRRPQVRIIRPAGETHVQA